MPFLGAGGAKVTEGSCSIRALPPAALHGGVGLSLCSESWQGEQGREGGSGPGGTFPLDGWMVSQQGGISPESAGEDARSAVAVGFAQFCSRLGLFPAPGFGFPRDVSHARPPQLFFSSGAFWGNQISRKAGFFQTRSGITSERGQSPFGHGHPRRAPAAQPGPPRRIFPAFKTEFPTQCDFTSSVSNSLHRPSLARLDQGSQR